MSKIYQAIVICLCALAIWLRFDGVFTKSFAFTYDVGRDMLALQNLAHGHLSLIGFTTGLPGVFYGPWWYWILLPAYLIGQGNPQYIDGFMALSGFLAIIILAILGRKIGGNFLSIALLAIGGVSGQLVSLSSQIWNPNLAPLWLSCMLLALYNLHQKPTKKVSLALFLALGILIGLLFEAEIVFGTLFVCGFFVFVLVYMRQWIKLPWIASLIAGFFMILSPRILFELRHNFLMTRTILSTFGQSAHHSFALSTLWTRAYFLLQEWSNSVGGDIPWVGAIIFGITVLLIGMYWKKYNSLVQFFVAFSGILTVVAWLLLVLFQHDLWSHYVVAYPLLWVFIVAAGIYGLYEYGNKWIACGLLVAVCLINVQPQKIADRLTKPLFQGDISVYRNELAIVDEVYKEAAGKPFKYIVYTPPIMDYPYQYLFQWYGKSQYGYSAGGPQEKLMFVIIEPDTDHPTLRNDWISSHAKDGVVVSEKIFPTHVILQRRIIP